MRFFCTPFIVALLLWIELLPQAAIAQATDTTKNVKIINADVLIGQELDGAMVRTMKGQVMLENKDVFIECDSAIHYLAYNFIKAFTNVHIVQQPCTHIFCDSLQFDGNKRTLLLWGNVIMQDDKMELQCFNLTYNLITRVGYYTEGGQLTQDGSVLTSERGYYYGKLSEVVFKGNVMLYNAKYNMTTDTLKYNMKSKIAYYRGPTTLQQQQSSIYCERGYFDTQNNYALFGKHTYLKDGSNELYADTMQYDQQLGIGKAFKNVYWKDNENKMSLRCFAGEYNERTGTIQARRNALLSYVENLDTLYVLADTIVSKVIDSLTNKRDFKAYRNTNIYRTDFQAIADSLYYTSTDSVFEMFGNPVVWADSTQLQADTIYLKIKNEKPAYVNLKNNAIVGLKHQYENIYDQIKAQTIDAYFMNNKIHIITAHTEASSIYYSKDDKGGYLGVNQSNADKMRFNFTAGELNKIQYYDKPKSIFYAMQNAQPSQFLLQNFEWKASIRPYSAVPYFKLPRQ